MKVILADTHGPILGKDQPAPNLSLLYLAAWARAHDADIEFRYLPQRYTLQDHLMVLRDWAPDVYALSFTSYGMPLAYELMRTVREHYPGVRIVCGGAHASAVPEHVLRHTPADVVVVGEGEQTLLELLQCLGDWPGALSRIDGIVYRDGRHLRHTAERALIDSLDSVPFPAWDLVHQEDYVGVSFSRGKPNTEMIITRGCPYRCTFCANPVFRGTGPRYRKRSPEHIAAEVEMLYGMGYREIFFHSDELNVQHAWSVEVCEALAALGHPDLFFQTNLRVAPMSEQFAAALKKANFWMVRIGIESANLRVLTGIKKRMSLEQTEYACGLLASHGIKVWGYFLLFQFWEEQGTLQVESAEEVRNSLRFAFRLWREGKLHYSSWAPSIPVQGAEFYDLARRRGMVDDDYYPSDGGWDPRPFMPGISNREYRMLFAQARWLQAGMALAAGAIEWRNWRAILHRARPLFTVRPQVSLSRGVPAPAALRAEVAEMAVREPSHGAVPSVPPGQGLGPRIPVLPLPMTAAPRPVTPSAPQRGKRQDVP
ncbi:MAG: radical SAM protein [Vicinamibacterales bacterium]